MALKVHNTCLLIIAACFHTLLQKAQKKPTSELRAADRSKSSKAETR